MLETLQAAGGLYIGFFAFGVVSGAFPIASAELGLIGVTIALHSLPQALVLAVLIAIGQTISHSAWLFTARGIARATTKRHAKWEARIAKARSLVEKWGERWILLLCLAAVFGLPPMTLASIAAGALGGVRVRTFVAIALVGRIVRFSALAIIAHYI